MALVLASWSVDHSVTKSAAVWEEALVTNLDSVSVVPQEIDPVP